MTTDQVRRVIGYVRVSKDEQVRSGLGLRAQEEAIQATCATRGWVLLEVIREEGVSGAVPWQERAGLSRAITFLSPSQRPSRSKSGSSPMGGEGSKSGSSPKTAPMGVLPDDVSKTGFSEKGSGKVDPHFSALARKTSLSSPTSWRAQARKSYAGTGREDRQVRRADALIVAKLDRLSRSVLDFASIAELARLEGWALVILDPEFDMSTPTGELLVGMLAQFAQFERRLIGQRTKEALAQKKASGWRPGRPRETSDLVNTLIWDLRAGYRQAPGHRPGMTIAGIKAYLDALPGEQWAPPRGRRWSLDTIRRVIRDMPPA